MAALPTNLKFDNSLGALLVGLIVSTTLFGLTSLQTYLYFVNYTKDRAAFKWLVGLLWMLDFVHTLFISHSAYYFLVQQYGNPQALKEGVWSIIMEVAVTTVMTVLVHGFLANRIYRLSHGNWILTSCVVILALGHAALGIASTIRLFQINLFSRLPEVLGVLSATLIAMAVNDVLITVALCYYLRKTQSTLNGTHDVIRLLIVYTIETGLLTSIFVTIDAVCVLTMPRNWIFIGLEVCVAKLYANSLLTILNSRRSVRKNFGNVSITPARSVSTSELPTAFASGSMLEVSTQSENTLQKYTGLREAPSRFEDLEFAPAAQPLERHDTTATNQSRSSRTRY